MNDLKPNQIECLLKLFPEGIVVFDLETTGLSPLMDKMIEIGAVKIDASGDISKWQSFINPQIPIDKKSMSIHGITDEMVADAPSEETVLPEFLEFCGPRSLWAHNAMFDIGFLVFALHQHKIEMPKISSYCSMKLARQTAPKLKQYKLATLAENFKAPLDNHHRASDDAFACAWILAELIINKDKRTDLKHALKESLLFRLDKFSKKDSYAYPEKLEGLQQPVREQEIIEIFYNGGSHRQDFRPVKPIGLLPLPRGAILYAQCLLSGLFKSFALNKIKEFRLLDEETKDKWTIKMQELNRKHEEQRGS